MTTWTINQESKNFNQRFNKRVITDVTKEKASNELEDFYLYMMQFYGKKGLYAEHHGTSFSYDEVKNATHVYCLFLLLIGKEFEGDTLDRERVRDIILTFRGIHEWSEAALPVIS